MKNIILACLTIVLIPLTNSYSDVYRCRDANGVLTFSDAPCGKDAELAFKTGHRIAKIEARLLDFRAEFYSPPGIGEEIRADVQSQVRPIAKSIGGQLFPGKQFSHFDDNPDRMYSAKVYYTPADKHDEYTLAVHFSFTRNTPPNYTFKITFIRILKNGKPFSPDLMYNARRLKKLKYGNWEVNKIQ